MTAAIWFRTLCQGTVMWMPLAGRIESGSMPSSSVRTSSDHTPAALTTDRGPDGEPLAVGLDLDAVGHAVGALGDAAGGHFVGDDRAELECRGPQDR